MVLALKLVPRDVRNAINRATTRDLGPAWKQIVAEQAARAGHNTNLVLVPGTRIKPGNPPVLIAATSRRPIGRAKRLVPVSSWWAYEFGAADDVDRYQRKNRTQGGTHTVNRHTARGLPRRKRTGLVVFPGVAEIAPRLQSLWVQTFMYVWGQALDPDGSRG
ncbi:hypothetical protein [Cellulomonas sp. A375-1]|uniref:hypothetical protein n=1 Tax=Cellulomonas sp. A375-1 TaxID=1672219 RepID=UPI0018CE9707|nr:hypothetical protein [Cellulomonas sp. A375-1]